MVLQCVAGLCMLLQDSVWDLVWQLSLPNVATCSAMQNLREAITGYRARLAHEGNDDKRNALLQVTTGTLH